MKKRLVRLLFFAVFILLISNISAGILVGNASNSVSKTYSSGQNLRGWVNLSLSAVPLTTEVKDTRANSIDVIDLLKSDSRLFRGTDYFCTPSDCGVRYVASNGQESKSFTLLSGETKTWGFEFTGDIDEITKVEFDIESNAASSCSNQMEITFMLSEPIVIGNNKSDASVCSILEDVGCFNESKSSYYNYVLPKGPSSKYCQRIKLAESPGFRLAAWMNLVNSGDITMAIYDINLDDELASCEISESTGNGEFSCDVNYLIINEDYYYICLYSDKDDEDSEIRGYPTPSGCGFYDTGGGGDELFAYDISATGKRFASMGKLHIGDALQGDISLSEEFDNFINEINGYAGNCTNGCVIPIKIKSTADQTVNISNISLRYEISGGGITTSKQIYDTNSSSATVSTNGFKQIYMDNANFTLPTSQGGIPYTLKIDNTNIFNVTITIQQAPQITGISPASTASKFPTTLNVFVTKVGNDTIKRYSWDINGSSFTTTEPRVSYSFDNLGNYPVEITVEDTAGRMSTRTFNVNVGSYISVLNSRINKSKADIARIEAQLANFSTFEQNEIKKAVNPATLKSNITQVESLYGQSNYEGAVALLLALNIPESIIAGIKTTYVPFYPNRENVNLDAIGGNYSASKESEYVSAIVEWHTTNIDSTVKYSKIVSQYEGGGEDLILNVIEFKAIKKTAMNYSSNIYIEGMDNLAFAGAYGAANNSGYFIIPIDSQEKTIIFSTTEDINFVDIPVFVSPAISNLVLIGDIGEEEAGMMWALLIALLFFLILAGLIVYIVLQQWYKNKYETYLFKDRNHLYNLITYIQNSKEKEIPENEIISKLKKAGWNSEQITYVMKKYIGKRTGMIWEIPIDKVLDWFRKRKVTAPLSQPAPAMAPKAVKPIVPVQRNFPAQRFPGAIPPGKREFFQK